jgi:hypothetical protein
MMGCFRAGRLTNGKLYSERINGWASARLRIGVIEFGRANSQFGDLFPQRPTPCRSAWATPINDLERHRHLKPAPFRFREDRFIRGALQAHAIRA